MTGAAPSRALPHRRRARGVSRGLKSNRACGEGAKPAPAVVAACVSILGRALLGQREAAMDFSACGVDSSGFMHVLVLGPNSFDCIAIWA